MVSLVYCAIGSAVLCICCMSFQPKLNAIKKVLLKYISVRFGSFLNKKFQKQFLKFPPNLHKQLGLFKSFEVARKVIKSNQIKLIWIHLNGQINLNDLIWIYLVVKFFLIINLKRIWVIKLGNRNLISFHLKIITSEI